MASAANPARSQQDVSPQPASPRPSPPPFDDPDADLILCSSDGVEFGVMKAILKVASPIFRDMFTIGSSTESSEIPVIHLAEDSRTLEDLLRFCYPIYTPIMFIPEDVGNLYQAADKYNIQGALEFSADTLRRLSAAYPMAVYAVACRLRLEDVATLAAQASLTVSLPDPLQDQSPSFQACSIKQLQTLCDYRVKCQEVLKEVSTTGYWIRNYSIPFHPLWSSGAEGTADAFRCCPVSEKTVTDVTGPRTVLVRSWWAAFMRDVYNQIYNLHTRGRSLSAEQDALHRALANASKCATCRPTAPQALLEFSLKLTGVMSTSIVKVPLPSVCICCYGL